MSRRKKSRASTKAPLAPPIPERMAPERMATLRRRLGFVALLWWISAVAGTLGLLAGLHAGWVRLLFIGMAWVLSAIFSFAWWSLRAGQTSQGRPGGASGAGQSRG